MEKPARPRRRMTAANAGIILVLMTFWVTLSAMVLPTSRVTDFLNLYVGGKLAEQGRYAELHDPDVQLQMERQYVPDKARLVPFVRPHFYAALLIPLAKLPFDAGFVAWISLHSALLLLCWYWSWVRFGADGPVLSALFLPPVLGLAHGQDCVFLLCIVIASYILATRNRPLSSGLVLALALMKFHLILLLPLAMLLRREWKMLAGFCLGGCGLMTAGLWLGGWKGTAGYVRMLLNKDGLEGLYPSPELMTNVHGLTRNLAGDNLAIQTALVILVVALVVLAVWNAPYERWLSAGIAGSLLAVPHVHGYDTSILLLPILLNYFGPRSAARVTAIVLGTPPVFLLLLGGRPWAAVPSLAMLAFLASLAYDNAAVLRVSRPVRSGAAAIALSESAH